MIRKINNIFDTMGQTSLILILLTAAALIFFAISLNWGRIAQTKALVTVAADQSAAQLASSAASYGEMEKETYLGNSNRISSLGGILMTVITVVVAVIILIISIFTYGAGAALYGVFFAALAVVLAVAAVVVAVVDLALQIAVVQPGITRLWDKLQKDQTVQQQFYEGGIASALQGSVTDQVQITDYFDLNTNGIYGVNWTNLTANDQIGRFAFFYTDRLKMLNWSAEKTSPQVAFFVNQLGELINGETVAQNLADNAADPQVPINPYCNPNVADPNFPGIDCNCDPVTDPSCNRFDPACQTVIPPPDGFQLNDACPANSDPSSSNYTPYCDPCCQPPIVIDLSYCSPNAPPPWKTCSNTSKLHPTPYKPRGNPGCYPSPLPNVCSPSNINANPYDQACYPVNGNCSTNNPYGASYPYIYDPTYQNYSDGLSFLDLFGRDQQMIPGNKLPLTSMTAQGSSSNGEYFPNGIYPFFWLMKPTDYSPQVNNINPATLQASQVHWCVPHTSTNGVEATGNIAGYIPPPATTLTAFPDMVQLGTLYTSPPSSTSPSGTTTSYVLPYTCSGKECCVGYLVNSVSGSVVEASGSIQINVPTPTISSITITPTGPVETGQSYTLSVTASEPSPGSIVSVVFQLNGVNEDYPVTNSGITYTASPPTIPDSWAGETITITAIATDIYGIKAQSPALSLAVVAPPPPPPPPSGG